MNKSPIQWTDATWNPVTGCTKISPGCKFCYAAVEHEMRRTALLAGKNIKAEQYREPFEKIQLHPKRIDSLPLHGAPKKVFVNSGSDLFHEDVPFSFLGRIFRAMALRPHMTFQILTKRPENMHAYMSTCGYKAYNDVRLETESWPARNIWLGVSVENQKYADERIPWLLKTPAAVRFLSCEPLLGPICFDEVPMSDRCYGVLGDGPHQNPVPGIHWAIVGGESGAGARAMHPDWARSIRDQCQAANVPFFFKQWGDLVPVHGKDKMTLDIKEKGDQWLNLAGGQGFHGESVYLMRQMKDHRQLDGREWNEFPKEALVC